MPSTSTEPLVGGFITPSMESRVDFPDPDGPMTARNSPGERYRLAESADRC